MKIRKCVGNGQGECTRCAKLKGFNRHWTSMLYKIDGCSGTYCSQCINDFKRLCNEMNIRLDIDTK